MPYRIRGLDPRPFYPLYGLAAPDLAARGAQRVIADAMPGYPDRITLSDAAPGRSLILLNFEHQGADTPYRSRHAIFVLEGATVPFDAVDEIPQAMRTRTLSLRAFDGDHMMVDAALVEGAAAEPLIARLLDDPRVAYLHAHYARRGCYAARIERA